MAFEKWVKTFSSTPEFFRRVWLFAALWTAALQAPLRGILQARTPEWFAMPYSRGSSQPRDQTQIVRIAGGFFTVWATREAQNTGLDSLSLLRGIFLTQESS